MPRRKCDCHLKEHQVCDICQGVKKKAQKYSSGLCEITMVITCGKDHGPNVRAALFNLYYMLQDLNPGNFVMGCRISDPKDRKA